MRNNLDASDDVPLELLKLLHRDPIFLMRASSASTQTCSTPEIKPSALATASALVFFDTRLDTN